MDEVYISISNLVLVALIVLIAKCPPLCH